MHFFAHYSEPNFAIFTSNYRITLNKNGHLMYYNNSKTAKIDLM